MSELKAKFKEILENKSHDYTDLSGTEAIQRALNFYGNTAIDVLLAIKLSRLESVLFKAARVEESFHDTLGDLCNYIAISVRETGIPDPIDCAFDPYFVVGFLRGRGFNIPRIIEMKIFSYLRGTSPSWISLIRSNYALVHDGRYHYHVNLADWVSPEESVLTYNWRYEPVLIDKSKLHEESAIVGTLLRRKEKLLYLYAVSDSDDLFYFYDVTRMAYHPSSFFSRYFTDGESYSLLNYMKDVHMKDGFRYTSDIIRVDQYIYTVEEIERMALIVSAMEANNIIA